MERAAVSDGGSNFVVEQTAGSHSLARGCSSTWCTGVSGTGASFWCRSWSSERNRMAAPKKPGVKVVKKKKIDTRTPELVESDIARAEQRLNEISEQMGTPEVARDPDKLIALNNEYHQTENLLRNLYEEWDRVTEPSTVAPGQSSA